MTYEELQEEVRRRAAPIIIEHSFDRLVKRHAKRSWRSCNCSYCQVKQNATYYIGTASYPPNYEGPIQPHNTEKDVYYVRKRNLIRQFYRKKMEVLL